MLPILHSYRFQSNEELLKIPILTSKIFALPIAPPSQLVSDIHCGRGTLRDANACLATLFISRHQTAIFFRYAQKRSLRYAPFTKSPIAQPAPPTQIR